MLISGSARTNDLVGVLPSGPKASGPPVVKIAGTQGGPADVRLFRRAFNSEGDERVLQEFSDYLTEELGRSDQTARAYVQQTTAVAEMLGKSITEVTHKDLRYEVKRDKSKPITTRNLRITSYKQLTKWALLEELPWAKVAILGVPLLPIPKRVPRPPITILDARKLLSACDSPNEHRAVYLPLYALVRAGEAARMNDSHLYGGDRLTFIGKGDKERTVPLHPRLREKLPIIFSSQPASPEVLEGVFLKMRDRLGIFDLKGKPATIHTLRRTGADFIRNKAGYPKDLVMAILGHEIDVTDIYAFPSFELMQPAVCAVDYDIGTPIQLSFF